MSLKPLETLGQKIRDARKKLSLGQAELASILGVSIPTVSEWENNRKVPSRDRWANISLTLRVSQDDLFSSVTRKNPPKPTDGTDNRYVKIDQSLVNDMAKIFAQLTGTVIGNTESSSIILESIKNRLEKFIISDSERREMEIFIEILSDFSKQLRDRANQYFLEFNSRIDENSIKTLSAAFEKKIPPE